MSLSSLALTVFIGNIPFGYWRANVPKLSTRWFAAVHLPVPLVILMRIFSGIGWTPASFPVLVGAFFLGQFTGGRLKVHLRKRSPLWSSSCLCLDALQAMRRPRKGEKKG